MHDIVSFTVSLIAIDLKSVLSFYLNLFYFRSWLHFTEDRSITNMATLNIVLFILTAKVKADHLMRISGLIYSQNNFELSVCSNANPLYYYALRVPHKADRWC